MLAVFVPVSAKVGAVWRQDHACGTTVASGVQDRSHSGKEKKQLVIEGIGYDSCSSSLKELWPGLK